MDIIYDGPFDAVEIPTAGMVARRGEPVTVPDDIAKSLIEQGWKPAKKPRTTKESD